MKKRLSRLLSCLLIALMLCALFVPTAFAAEGDATVAGITEYTKVKSVSESYIVYYDSDLLSSAEKLPVIIWANGTFCAPASYTALLNGLARKGYIVVASSDMMSGDGTMQSKQLDFILAENEDPNSRFYQKVDTKNVAAAGHSQGGRSTVNALNSDSRFKCGISLAGSNTKDENKKLNLTTPILYFSGQLDLIVPANQWILPTYSVTKGPALYACRKWAIHTTCWEHPTEYVTYMDLWCRAHFSNIKNPTTENAVYEALKKDDDWKDVQGKNLSSSRLASILSEGSFLVIAVILVLAASALVVLLLKKKKKAAA